MGEILQKIRSNSIEYIEEEKKESESKDELVKEEKVSRDISSDLMDFSGARIQPPDYSDMLTQTNHLRSEIEAGFFS